MRLPGLGEGAGGIRIRGGLGPFSHLARSAAPGQNERSFYNFEFSLTGTSGDGFSLPKGGPKGEKLNRAPALAPGQTVTP